MWSCLNTMFGQYPQQSASAMKSLGAECSPNGNTASNIAFRRIASPEGGSLEGVQYTLSRSSLASKVPCPLWRIIDFTSSINTYDSVQNFGSMPSLILSPLGCGKLMMRCHYPGWCCLGMIPNQLMMMYYPGWCCLGMIPNQLMMMSAVPGSKGPTILPKLLSSARYLHTT